MSFAPLAAPTAAAPQYESSGGRLVAVDGRSLPLLQASLTADAKGGLARVTLEQTFRNPYDEPLRVTYSLPLPADGAVSGFAFRVGDERVVGEVDRRASARQRFEDAILEGQTAALLDQERSSLFTQEVGNIPPRTVVVCEVRVDQKLAWLPDGAWEWRFPTVVAPRYLGAPGQVADHRAVSIDVADGELPVKLGLLLAIRDRLADAERPQSPSHMLHSERGLGTTSVTFGDGRGAALDRDVVVRWRVAGLTVGAELDLCRPATGPSSTAAYGLVTLVPPSAAARMTALSRDLIVLLDTSGSMSGAPLSQAKRLTAALVDSLTDGDQLELVEFSSAPRRWKRGAVAATASHRRDAQQWLSRLSASGGTEMRAGILEALAPLRAESQRQVVLITDGLIGGEAEVLEAIARRLPRGSRVHTVGVGSGVNRSLTGPAARAGRGVELLIGLSEDVEPFVGRLLSRTDAPLLTDTELSGSALLELAPRRLPDLFGGAPAMLSVKLRPEGGELVVRSRSAEGDVEQRLTVTPTELGEGSPAVATLFGRELVEELELALATGASSAEVDPAIERVGLDFQLATRLTSWVAVSARATVDPRAPRRQETMPHALAHGLSAEGVGLRAALGSAAGAPPFASQKLPMAVPRAARSASPPSPSPSKKEKGEGLIGRARRLFAGAADVPAPAPESASTPARADEAKAEAEAREEASSAVPRGAVAAGRRLQGRARRQGRRLIIELVLVAPLEWAPTASARLERRDGASLEAPVELGLTTAPGTLAAGLVVTLVLLVDEDLAELAVVHLSNGGEPLEVLL